MDFEIVTKVDIHIAGLWVELTASQKEKYRIIRRHWQHYNGQLRKRNLKVQKKWQKYGVFTKVNGTYLYLSAIPAKGELEPVHKWPFCPNPSLLSKFNPRNINYMPVVKFIERLDLKQKFSFMDRHELTGFENLVIAGGQFAKFCHKGSLQLMRSTVHDIYKNILPQSNLKIDTKRVLIHYEHYDYRFHWNRSDSIIERYLYL